MIHLIAGCQSTAHTSTVYVRARAAVKKSVQEDPQTAQGYGVTLDRSMVYLDVTSSMCIVYSPDL